LLQSIAEVENRLGLHEAKPKGCFETELPQAWLENAGQVDSVSPPQFKQPLVGRISANQTCGQDALKRKTIAQYCQTQSDDKKSVANALQQHGLALTQNHRREFVSVDLNDGTYAVISGMPTLCQHLIT